MNFILYPNLSKVREISKLFKNRSAALAYVTLVNLEAKRMGLQKKNIETDELRMVFWQRGPQSSREALIFVHGYTADKDVWIRFSRTFSRHFRIIIPDMAGHGETEWNPTLDFSPSAQAARILVLMDRLCIDKAILVGNSMGGAIAATFAADYPHRTSRLVLINPGGVRAPSPSRFDALYEHGESPFLVDSFASFRALYAMTMAKPPFIPMFLLREVSRRYQERKLAYAKIAEYLQIDSVETKVESIQSPTLVLWGQEDQIIDVSATKVWGEKLPHYTIKTLSGIGHMPMVECPTITARIVQDFLRESA